MVITPSPLPPHLMAPLTSSTSSESGVCGPVFRNHNVVKADVLKKPKRPGSTQVKFVFKKPATKPKYGQMYRCVWRRVYGGATDVHGMCVGRRIVIICKRFRGSLDSKCTRRIHRRVRRRRIPHRRRWFPRHRKDLLRAMPRVLPFQVHIPPRPAAPPARHIPLVRQRPVDPISLPPRPSNRISRTEEGVAWPTRSKDRTSIYTTHLRWHLRSAVSISLSLPNAEMIRCLVQVAAIMPSAVSLLDQGSASNSTRHLCSK